MMKGKKQWLVALFFVMTLILAACSEGNEDSANNANMNEDSQNDSNEVQNGDEGNNGLQVMEGDEVGEYLADSEGMTLYIFTDDEEGVSNCEGECLENWPAFHADDFDVPKGYDKEDFGTITRDDTENEQVTYKGYPLYYFAGDDEKGDVEGQGKKDVWYVVNDESFQEHIEKDQSTSLSSGIDKVLANLKDLKNAAESAPNNDEKINEKGVDLSESWEPIEETIEERDAQAYENIEESLYPLISEAQKDELNIDKVKKLIDDTIDKIEQFQKKMTKTTSAEGKDQRHIAYVNDRDDDVLQVIDQKKMKS